MTTCVVIATPAASAMDVGLYIQTVDAAGQQVGELRPWTEMTDGQSLMGYVYEGNRIVIAEVPKRPTVEDPSCDQADDASCRGVAAAPIGPVQGDAP